MSTLLEALWGGPQGFKCIVAIHGNRVNHLYVDSPSQAEQAAQKLSDNGVDVYFAPARFSDKRRTQDNALGINALWVDVDCGEGKPYPTWKHGLLAILQWCKAQQFWRPSYIIRSGNGLHVYWLLDAAYPHEAWQPVARHFKQALALGQMHADPTRTADAASILRLPGTRNWKDPDEPKPVEQLFGDGRRLSLDEFQSKLPKVGPLRSVERPKDDEWNVPDNYPAGDAPAIADACQQMGKVRDTRGKLEEPHWRAGLSVLKRCDRADFYVHEWSKGDPRYDAAQTQEKADRTAGPATCQHFSEVHPGGCVGCPHAGKVTSPVQLAVAGATPEPTEKNPGEPEGPAQQVDDSWRPTQVNNFRITDAGIYLQPPADAEDPTPARVTEIPLWIVEVREKARLDTEGDESSLLVEWKAVDGRTKRGILRQSDVHELRSFKAWLADHNIISAISEVKLLVAYIGQYTLKLLKKQGAREYHEHLGWYNEGFVVGDRVITKDGAQPALVQSSNPIHRVKPSGSLEQWREGMKLLDKPKYARHAFALLCGFGSPILHLVNAQSAVVSLVGRSGAGKTLAARTALSIYGNPDLLGQGASATANAVEQQLTSNRHVPYLLDEVTEYPAHKLTEFIYLAANGQGKAALTRTRQSRQAGSWQLVPFITSNLPVLEFNQRDVQEAHRRRILELTFWDVMDGKDGARVDEIMRVNHGVAAEPFLKEVAKLRGEIPAMFERCCQLIKKQHIIAEANRFGLWTAAAALVGGTIAKAAGLIDMDPYQIVKQAMTELEAAVQDTRTDQERTEHALAEWLTQNSKRVCHWGRSQKDLGEVVDDPIARNFGNGEVAIHRKEFNALLQHERISKTAIRAWLADNIKETKVVRLAPGGAGIWCHILPAEAVGMGKADDG